MSTQTDIGDDALAAEGDKALNREASKSDHSATLPIVDSESICEDASSVSICSQPSQVIQHCQIETQQTLLNDAASVVALNPTTSTSSSTSSGSLHSFVN